MGEWGTVTFVHTTRQRALKKALDDVLSGFGYRRVEDAPDRGRLDVLVLGGSGWTAVKCSDPELLAKRPTLSASRKRTAALGLLTKAIGRYGFLMSVYDGDSIAILEAQADGTCLASGGEAATGSAFLQEETIARTRFMRPRFYRLKVSRELKELTQDGGMFTDEVSALLVPHVDPFYVFTDMAMAKREPITRGEWLTFTR